MDLEALERWLSFERRSKASVEQILEDIASAIKDYSRVFPPPCGLAPNLQLASEASAALTVLLAERREAMDSQGLPQGASLEELIQHHRGGAGLAAAMAAFTLGGDLELGIEDRLKLTDEEWGTFQRIPEQGYSHRAWVDARIKERVALTLAQFVADRARATALAPLTVEDQPMTSKIPFERFTVTVDYKPILPTHRDLVLDALESCGAPMPLPDSLFESERFVISFSAQTEDHEIRILEAIRWTMNEIYGPVGAAWSRIAGEWS